MCICLSTELKGKKPRVDAQEAAGIETQELELKPEDVLEQRAVSAEVAVKKSSYDEQEKVDR